tara:strand:- start:163 stop:471 length:309 start_codon:yes stop_codon:yes gene_type:complete
MLLVLVLLLLLVVVHVVHVVLDLSFSPKMKIFRQKRLFFLLGKNNFISHLSFVTTRLRERRSERRGGEVFFVSRDKRRHVWSEDASAEKTDWGERCVGFDCE